MYTTLSIVGRGVARQRVHQHLRIPHSSAPADTASAPADTALFRPTGTRQRWRTCVLRQVHQHLRSPHPRQRLPLLCKPHHLASWGALERRQAHDDEAAGLRTATPASAQPREHTARHSARTCPPTGAPRSSETAPLPRTTIGPWA